MCFSEKDNMGGLKVLMVVYTVSVQEVLGSLVETAMAMLASYGWDLTQRHMTSDKSDNLHPKL